MITKMTKLIGALFLAVVFCSSAMAAETDAIQGKWKAEREVDGQKAVFHLEIKGSDFKFELKDGSGDTRMVAKGKVKVEKQGPFKTLTLHDIEAGQSESDLQPYDDDRAYVYVTGWRTMTLAGNFDRERENEEPNVMVYRKE